MWDRGPVAIIAVTQGAVPLATFLAQRLSASLYLREGLAAEGNQAYRFKRLSKLMPQIFSQYAGLIFIMAQGIVQRVIAPYLQDKHKDPAVVVLDDLGRYVISALSGHEGQANALALEISSLLGAEPVITTASEATRTYILGLGWRKGTQAKTLITAVEKALNKAEITLEQVRLLSSAWVKKDDPVTKEVHHALGIPWRFLPKWLLRHFYQTSGYPRSQTVFRHLGVYGVAEPCALLSGVHTQLVLPKQAYQGVTVAVAKEHLPGETLFPAPADTLILGGTTEAETLARKLSAQGKRFYLSVATDYGAELFEPWVPEGHLLCTRFTKENLQEFVRAKGIRRLIDCTHPYAQEITRLAREVAQEEGLEYVSLVRKDTTPPTAGEKLIKVESLVEAARKIKALGLKRVLFTTGSKDLSFVPVLADCEVFVRVLPYEESIKACLAAGLPRHRILALQGPFSTEFNLALIREYHLEALVTKASGKAGGFPEKLSACRQAGIWAILLERT